MKNMQGNPDTLHQSELLIAELQAINTPGSAEIIKIVGYLHSLHH